jgi:hypothetical protein
VSATTLAVVALVVVFLFYNPAPAAASSLGTSPPRGYADGSPRSTSALASGYAVATGVVASLPLVGQTYAALNPIAQKIVIPTVNKVNAAIGSPDFFGTGSNTVVHNADGSFTYSEGPYIITRHPDGSITHTVAQGNLVKPAKAVAHVVATAGRGIESGVKSAASAVSSGARKALGWL